jgi:hypothetical protein
MEVIVDLDYCVSYRPSGSGSLPQPGGFGFSIAADVREAEIPRQGHLVFGPFDAPWAGPKTSVVARWRHP